MICNRCKRDFIDDSTGVRIQRNTEDGHYYCMQCAVDMYYWEPTKMKMFYTISDAAYIQIVEELQLMKHDLVYRWLDDTRFDRILSMLHQAVIEEKEEVKIDNDVIKSLDE